MECIRYLRDIAKDLGIEKDVKMDEEYLKGFDSVEDMIDTLSNSGFIEIDRYDIDCCEGKLIVEARIIRGDKSKKVKMIFGLNGDDKLEYEGIEVDNRIDEVDVVLLSNLKFVVEANEECLSRLIMCRLVG